MSRFKSIQALRGIAACAVVLLHARSFAGPGIADSAFRLGAAGVDLFFVISGFIIASIPKRSPGQFLFDRFWRVFPLWLIASTPWLLWAHSSGRTIAATLTLWPIYSHYTMPVIPIGWTLSFEMLFYLAATLALLSRPSVPIGLFVAALTAGTALQWPIFDLVGNPIIFEFLFGVLISKMPRDERLGIPIVLMGATLLAISPLQIYSGGTAVSAAHSLSRATFWGFPCAVVIYGALSLERYFARIGPLVFIGEASYSIYLFHIPAMQFGAAGWPLQAKLAVGIAAGIVAHLMIERPIQLARQRARSLVFASDPASTIIAYRPRGAPPPEAAYGTGRPSTLPLGE